MMLIGGGRAVITTGAGRYSNPAERDPDVVEQDLVECRMIGPS
jgi:hypothetical protein